MAVYQFLLNVIPRKGLIEKYGLIPEQLDIDYAERRNHYDLKKEGLIEEGELFKDALIHDWWSSTKLMPIEIIHQIDKMIQRGHYGADTFVIWKFYSSEVDNDAAMSINSETGQIEELYFRADLREPKLKFLCEMIALAHQYDCLLMDIKGNLVNPELQAVVRLIETSNAYRFLQDPTKFLTSISPNV